MRILHVGSGFRPWRRGGLVAYIEDLMREQARRGHDLDYFFSGRQYPWVNGPRLRRWERGGVAMLEVVNSPLYDHGRQPQLELAEPGIERMLDRVIDEVRPDVVHVQELAGLPSSVLEIVRRAGVPTVVTLHDYFPLCSTFRLLDAQGQVCLRQQVGADCAVTTAADPRHPGLMIAASVQFDLARMPLVRRVDPSRRGPWIRRLANAAARRDVARRRSAPVSVASPEAFQRRREVNIDRLNRAGCLIAVSNRVADIYSQLGVSRAKIRTLELTLAHIERLRPRRSPGQAPLTFATLAGLESVAKGGQILLEAMSQLLVPASEGRLRLLVFGHALPELARQAATLPGVEIRGAYEPDELDTVLEEVDVGIMPSIWEEAYGFAGIEFLAKGIPVIANAIGGMPEYTRDGETGWLNRSCSAPELARIMRDVVERPEQVGKLNARILASRHAIIKPMARHGDEMDAIYRELVSHGAAQPLVGHTG
jgi:glycosyltransferase involved in cell wall biosynthesis